MIDLVLMIAVYFVSNLFIFWVMLETTIKNGGHIEQFSSGEIIPIAIIIGLFMPLIILYSLFRKRGDE